MSARDEPVAVLLVDDDEDDYIITREMLAEQERARFVLDDGQGFLFSKPLSVAETEALLAEWPPADAVAYGRARQAAR